MQTIYCTTANITSRPEKVVNLEDYRRRLELEEEGSLAPQPQDWEEDPVIQGPWAPRAHRPRRRRSLPALLDLWCSLGVLAMTLTFTLRVLIA